MLLHAMAIGSAVLVLGEVRPTPQDPPFRWEVSTVQPPKPEPVADQTPTSVKPAPVKPTPVKSTPTPVTPTDTMPVGETVVSKAVQTVQPVQREETREIREEVREVRPVEQVVERSMQAVTRPTETMAPTPAAPHVVAQSATTVSMAAPVVEAPRAEAVVHASQPVAQAAPEPVVATPSIDTATASVREVAEPNVPATQPAPGPLEAPPAQVVALPAVPTPAAKADFRWVGQALGDRVRELLVYPARARLSNLSGKVLVKVVIREDGQLHQVEILKGSGHEALDEAAIELVRRATPIKMKHVLGRPFVTITLPITYELVG